MCAHEGNSSLSTLPIYKKSFRHFSFAIFTVAQHTKNTASIVVALCLTCHRLSCKQIKPNIFLFFKPFVPWPCKNNPCSVIMHRIITEVRTDLVLRKGGLSSQWPSRKSQKCRPSVCTLLSRAHGKDGSEGISAFPLTYCTIQPWQIEFLP